MTAIQRFWRTHLASPSPDFVRAASPAALATAGVATVAVADSFVASGAIPPDKVKHFGATLGMTLTGHFVLGLPPWLAASSSFVVGTVGKELIWDLLLGRGTADPMDAVANLAGAAAGWAAIKAVHPSGNKMAMDGSAAPA